MRSFDKWLDEQKPQAAPEQELPEGVWESDGSHFAYCRSCGNSYELFHDTITEGFDPDMSYCGGSPYCCP